MIERLLEALEAVEDRLTLNGFKGWHFVAIERWPKGGYGPYSRWQAAIHDRHAMVTDWMAGNTMRESLRRLLGHELQALREYDPEGRKALKEVKPAIFASV